MKNDIWLPCVKIEQEEQDAGQWGAGCWQERAPATAGRRLKPGLPWILRLRRDDARREVRFSLHRTKRAVMAMRKVGQGGSIINISSVAGIAGVPACGAYAAAKGGLRIFSKTIAMETAKDKIRVNTVHPGMILTNMQGVALEDNADNYDATLALVPMGYMGDPLDIANMNLFLASDEARYITGAEMVVDGGMMAH